MHDEGASAIAAAGEVGPDDAGVAEAVVGTAVGVQSGKAEVADERVLEAGAGLADESADDDPSIVSTTTPRRPSAMAVGLICTLPPTPNPLSGLPSPL